MPITFSCPTCHLRMTVAETMAGKRGKCSKCKNPVIVPSVQAPSPPPAPAPPEDIEAAALDALAEPKQEQKAVEFVEFNCPQCDEPVKLGLEHAGKRHPCPHC